MHRISVKGILIGTLTMIGAMTLIPLLIIATTPFLRRNDILSALGGYSTPYYLVIIVLICLTFILGGYVGARVAKREEVLNGTSSSLFVVGSSLLLTAAHPRGVNFVALLCTMSVIIALAALGGYLRHRQVRAKQA